MYEFEPLGDQYKICVSREHKFGTDAFLLAGFAGVRRGSRCADLGSGCGIIPTLWFRWGLEPQIAYAVELQEQGYRQMTVTVGENALEGRLVPLHRDIKELDRSIENASLDLVTCNPPYKMQGHGVPCPDAARLTARHEVACSLNDVCTVAARLLRFGGRFCLCQRPERLPDIFAAMRSAGMEPKRMRFVQQRPEKQPWLVLVEGRKGGKPFMRVEAPLIVENGEGGFSEELLEIYRNSKAAERDSI